MREQLENDASVYYFGRARALAAAGGNRVEVGMGCSSLYLLPGVCVRCVRCVCCVCYSFCVPCVLLLSEFLC